MDTLRMEASPSNEESYLYHPQAYEAEGDIERRSELMQRREDLRVRLELQDAGRSALRAFQQAKSVETADTVRKHRRKREAIERQQEGLETARRNRRTKVPPVLTAEEQYSKELSEKYDNPRSKARRTKEAADAVPKGYVEVEADGPTTDEVVGTEEG